LHEDLGEMMFRSPSIHNIGDTPHALLRFLKAHAM